MKSSTAKLSSIEIYNIMKTGVKLKVYSSLFGGNCDYYWLETENRLQWDVNPESSIVGLKNILEYIGDLKDGSFSDVDYIELDYGGKISQEINELLTDETNDKT